LNVFRFIDFYIFICLRDYKLKIYFLIVEFLDNTNHTQTKGMLKWAWNYAGGLIILTSSGSSMRANKE